jgi:Integrase zinc binding domain
MYASMRQKFFWKEMYKDVEETVRNCTVCAKNRVTERKRTSFLKLFPADGPLAVVEVPWISWARYRKRNAETAFFS